MNYSSSHKWHFMAGDFVVQQQARYVFAQIACDMAIECQTGVPARATHAGHFIIR